jgi:hypothetical protein
LGGNVALFVLLLVGIVVAQTWLDWRDTRRGSRLPDWAKGMALASVVAITFASAATYAAMWIEGEQSSVNTASRLLWPEVGFLLSAMGVIVMAVRKKRLRWIFVLGGIVMAAFWAGMTLSR